MKKNLLFSLFAAGTLLAGGLGAYAVSQTNQPAATRATLDVAGMVASPENGGSTSALPNNSASICQKFLLYLMVLKLTNAMQTRFR